MGVLFGLLSSLAIGASELFGRKVTIEGGALRAGIVIQLWAFLALSVAALVMPGEIVGSDLAIGAVSGLFMGFGLYTYFEALLRSSATIVAPVVAAMVVLIPFGYSLARGSRPSLAVYLAAAVVLAGVLVITSGGERGSHVGIGVRWGLISGAGYGIGLAVILGVSDNGGQWPGSAQRAAAFVLMLALGVRSGETVRPPKGLGALAALSGVLAGSTTLFYLIGQNFDEIGAVVGGSVFPAVSVAVGAMFFGDKVSVRQLVGIIVVIVGIAGIAVL